MNRLLLSLMFTFVLPFAQAAQKPLTIGTSTLNPPFESLADQKNHFYGFDIDIMEEICHRIQMPCRFVPSHFNNLFADLAGGKIDLAISAIIITHQRKQFFLFSLPYLASRAQFITTQDSPIQKTEQLRDKVIGVRAGTLYRVLALSLYDNHVKIKELSGYENLLEALQNKTIDAALMSRLSANYWLANSSSLYKLIGTKIPIGEGYGIMANKNKQDLIFKINQALLNMEADGSYLAIYNRYF